MLKFKPTAMHNLQQRGVVLFFTLVALLVMSLAAVALIRSVDTATLIAGNLSFKQASTNSSSAAAEVAMDWLINTQAAASGISVITNSTHPLNQDQPANGYYSSMDPAANLTNGSTIQWTNADSKLVFADAQGNTVRYVIHRMCYRGNQALVDPVAGPAGCLFSGATLDNNEKQVPLPPDICNGEGCPKAGQSPQMRITTRTTGPRGTISYVQTFVN